MHTVERLRIRPGSGPGRDARARRLARVAHQHLGHELDAVLTDLDSEAVIDIGVVEVTLTSDPDDLDDQALAALWAALIGDELTARGLTCPARSAPDSPPDPSTDPAGEAAAPLAAMLRACLSREEFPPVEALRELAALCADESVVAHAVDSFAGDQRGRALAFVEAATDLCVGAAGTSRPATTTAPRPAGDPTDPTAPTAPAPRSADGPSPRQPVPDHRTGQPAGGSDRASPEVTEPGTPAALDPGFLRPRLPTSAVGGLVLLHHRLRTFLDRVVATTEPDGTDLEDVVAIRRGALALLAAGPGHDADPLVRLLAGDGEWSAEAPLALCPPLPREVVELAESCLAAFAGDLPGFESSSPGFVRDQWIGRSAVLFTDGDAVIIRLSHRPLDLVLDRLPYPVGALRLPWSPTLQVGWEPRP